MKRTQMTALLLALLLALSLAGCSGEKQDPQALADSILAEVNFEADLVQVAEGAVENWYFMGDEVTAYAIYINAGTVPLEEIAVLAGEDTAALNAVLDRRLEDLAGQFVNYVPEEMVKIQNPTRATKGNVAVLVLSDDPEAAQKVEELLG